MVQHAKGVLLAETDHRPTHRAFRGPSFPVFLIEPDRPAAHFGKCFVERHLNGGVHDEPFSYL